MRGAKIKPTIIMRCFACGGEFQFGPHIYAGKHIPAYKVTVCTTCYSANWDGWAPVYEPEILKHLKAEGIVVPLRNAGGWLPRDG